MRHRSLASRSVIRLAAARPAVLPSAGEHDGPAAPSTESLSSTGVRRDAGSLMAVLPIAVVNPAQGALGWLALAAAAGVVVGVLLTLRRIRRGADRDDGD